MFKTTFSSRSIFTLPKGTTSNLHFFVNPYRGTSIIFCDQNKCAKISFFSKKKMLQDTIYSARRSSFAKCKQTQFSSKKISKWFTFLPFETPTTLFLPKIGTVLLYSCSFSTINGF